MTTPGDQETIAATFAMTVRIVRRASGYYYGRGAGWRGPQYGGGLLGLVLIILLVLWLTGTMGPGVLR